MITIIGAGMAGLLAAGMLRNEASMIIEAQEELPNNHSALLRFRSPIVGDTLNIPFKKVQVMKAVDGSMNPIAAALSYSRKTNGTATLRSSVSATGEMSERWIAPPNLIEQMAAKVTCPINFDHSFLGSEAEGLSYISTIPMGLLMRTLGYPGYSPGGFPSVGGYNINVDLFEVDAYATLYLPDRQREENRISITGNRLTIEVALPGLPRANIEGLIEQHKSHPTWLYDTVDYAMEKLGLWGVRRGTPTIKAQPYAKILPIDENVRRDFIVWASEKHNVYSLGRFATWRPGLLLDDLVKDIRIIQELTRGRGAYDLRKKEI